AESRPAVAFHGTHGHSASRGDQPPLATAGRLLAGRGNAPYLRHFDQWRVRAEAGRLFLHFCISSLEEIRRRGSYGPGCRSRERWEAAHTRILHVAAPYKKAAADGTD